MTEVELSKAMAHLRHHRISDTTAIKQSHPNQTFQKKTEEEISVRNLLSEKPTLFFLSQSMVNTPQELQLTVKSELGK